MQQIYPLHEEHINRFCGMPVCIVTKEGERHVGVISRSVGGRLYLNEGPEESGNAPASHETHGDTPYLQGKESKKGRKSKKNEPVKKAEKAETKAYPYAPYPYYPFGGAFAIDLALIAFLFLLL
ncbi:hypothetical protein [Paenibacillus mendelii]|uniref:Uncharacterized protein n=1 Tax=Paenibacillus mendelii TaxID=206163 RepID=A0ABV6JK30_9BACL|nr:hypothetical protein [Paenibacillus mendelii]MCQ6559203.1 hypothetical protein [Paenibacillus mendelii]